MSLAKLAAFAAELESMMGFVPPEIGKVYEHPQDGPILITGGQYWGAHGISNFWYWKVLGTGEEKNGYGGVWSQVAGPVN